MAARGIDLTDSEVQSKGIRERDGLSHPSLTVLSAMITPAVLISACGTLILSTSQRLGRVIERVQKWSDRLNAAVATPAEDEPARDDLTLMFAAGRE